MAERNKNKPQKKKLRTMILSLILAVFVWFMVVSLTNPSITVKLNNLKVRLIGTETLTERNITFTGLNDEPSISASVTGNRTDLMNYMDDIYVQVDVSDIDELGEYELEGRLSIPTTRITAEHESVGTIKLNAEELVTKEVDIEVKQTGSLKDKIVKSEPRNKKVLISGAKSEIDDVKGAVATIDISEIKEGPALLSYLLVNANGNLVKDNETIESPRSEIEVMNTIYDIKTLPVEPELSPELSHIYTLDREKTTLARTSVIVGVRNNANYDNVKLIIDKNAENGEVEYSLKTEENMYIPQENIKIKAKPELVSRDPAVPIENGENK